MKPDLVLETPVVRSVTDRDLVLDVPPGSVGALDVLLDGRRIWSFHVEDAAGGPPGARIGWPEVLRPFLVGRGRFALRRSGEEAGPEVEVVLGGAPDRALALADADGRPLVVNKWGRLGRALGDGDPGATRRVLEHAEDVRSVLAAELDLEVFVTGGTLLGAVREGRLLGHDDDVDLGYVSRHEHPLDVAREGYEVGRVLRRAGYDVLRHSPGHVQVHFVHEGAVDHYVDVFAGFVRDGCWHQLFCIRHPASRDDLLPRSEVEIDGRSVPAPRDTGLALVANYGPTWRTPDPAFRFETPTAIRRRLDNWFPGVHAEREDWESRVEPRRNRPGSSARWLADRAEGLGAIDLGCGRGDDTRYLAERLGCAVGLDWSRPAIRAARGHPSGTAAEFHVLNVRDLRTTVETGARLAARPHGWAVLVGRLLDHLDPDGRHHVLRFLGMVLRRGGLAVVEAAPGDVGRYAAEMAEHRLEVVLGAGDDDRTRMVITWPCATS